MRTRQEELNEVREARRMSRTVGMVAEIRYMMARNECPRCRGVVLFQEHATGFMFTCKRCRISWGGG